MRPGLPASLAGIVLLAAWLGAAVLVAGVVAPAAFAVLPSRALAGALVGRVLPVVFWSGMLVGAVVAAMSWWLPASVWRTGAALTMVAACAAAQLVVAPRIAAIRVAAGGQIDALAPGDPRRAAFGQLHGVSVLLMGLGVVGALVALCFLISEQRSAGRLVG